MGTVQRVEIELKGLDRGCNRAGDEEVAVVNDSFQNQAATAECNGKST